jgi:hypothetical protein
MNRREFLQTSGFVVGHAMGRSPLASLGVGIGVDMRSDMPDVASRGWILCLDPRLGGEGQQMVQAIQAGVGKSPLLTALASSRPARMLPTGEPTPQLVKELAYSHVILIGFADDPLIRSAWQREARMGSGGMYVFGFGNLKGRLGYLESDRNPFLHSSLIERAPFETELITITGTDKAGIGLAVRAMVERGLVSGIVADAGWTRGTPTLLDRAPLPVDFEAPAMLPMSLGRLSRIALVQASEDEYRGVLDDTGIEPLSIWRAKYYALGVWDGKGAASAFVSYTSGLHRRAYGNTIWAARFSTSADATSAAKKIAGAARLSAGGRGWIGALPPYANGTYVGESASPGTLELWNDGTMVMMSSLLR